MKKIFILLFCILTVSIWAQKNSVLHFDAYRLTAVDNSTKTSKEISIDYRIKLTDRQIIIYGKTTESWLLTSPISSSSTKSFYSYGYDKYDNKCRVWFRAIDETHCAFGIEYSDFSFLYSCTYRK